MSKTSHKKNTFIIKPFSMSVIEQQRKERGPPTIAFIGNRGTGKCLGENIPVLMFNGEIKLSQDIKIGDVLMGDDSKPRNVLNTHTGVSEMYKIKQGKGDTYTINDKHILTLYVSATNSKTRGTEKQCQMKILDKLYSKGDIVDIPIEDFLNLSDTAKNTRLKGYRVSVSFKGNKLKYDLFKYTTEFLKGDIPLDIAVSSNSRKIRLQFLAYIINQCGNLTGEGTAFEIRNKQKVVLDAVKTVCCTLGFTFKSSTKSRTIISGYGIHEIPCSTKAKKYSDSKNYLISRISVESIGVGNYFGFEVDGNHRFLLGDCTVVHNSVAAKSTLAHLKMNDGIVMSGTTEGCIDFGKVFPSSFIREEVDMERIKKLIINQKKKAKKYGARETRTKDIDTLLLLEDCMAEKKPFKTKEMRDIFMNGRHMGICFIITVQYATDLPPALRSQIDYLFATREINHAQKRKLHEYFFGCIEKYKDFDKIFTEVTKNHGLIVLDKTDTTGEVSNIIKRYTAPYPAQKFKFGSKSFWELHKKKVDRKRAAKLKKRKNAEISVIMES